MFFIGIVFTALRALVLNRLARKLYNSGKRMGAWMIRKCVGRVFGKKAEEKLPKVLKEAEKKPEEKQKLTATVTQSGDSNIPHIDAVVPAGAGTSGQVIHLTLHANSNAVEMTTESVQTTPSLLYQQEAEEVFRAALKRADQLEAEIAPFVSNSTDLTAALEEVVVIPDMPVLVGGAPVPMEQIVS